MTTVCISIQQEEYQLSNAVFCQTTDNFIILTNFWNSDKFLTTVLPKIYSHVSMRWLGKFGWPFSFPGTKSTLWNWDASYF